MLQREISEAGSSGLPINTAERLSEIVDGLHERAIAEVVKQLEEKYSKETADLKNQIEILQQTKALLEGKLLEEQRRVSNLFIDAEQLRSDLHKEIKDYRGMKKKLKSIILKFGDSLEELRNRQFMETQD